MSHQQTYNYFTAATQTVIQLPKTILGTFISNINKAGQDIFTTGIEMTKVVTGRAAYSLFAYELLPLSTQRNQRLIANRVDLKTKWVFS